MESLTSAICNLVSFPVRPDEPMNATTNWRSLMESRINTLVADGWELVTLQPVMRHGSTISFIGVFRRP